MKQYLKGTAENLPLLNLSAGINDWVADWEALGYNKSVATFSEAITAFDDGANTITLSQDITYRLERSRSNDVTVGGLSLTVASVAGNVVTVEAADLSSLVVGGQNPSIFSFNYTSVKAQYVVRFWESLAAARANDWLNNYLSVEGTYSFIGDEILSSGSYDDTIILQAIENYLVTKRGMDGANITIENYTI